MPDITEKFEATTRLQWRRWLEQHHAKKTEIWLIADLREAGTGPSYLDTVEEALCFGWIDGIAKKFDDVRRAQRFSPRRPKGNWTELNKVRVRRLMAEGMMTPAGLAVLPDMTEKPIVLSPDVKKALVKAKALEFFTSTLEVYQRIRLSYVEMAREEDDAEFKKRLDNLVKQSAAKVMFGNWDDSEMRRTPPKK